MHPYTDMVDLAVSQGVTVQADVVSSQLIDGVYFYDLLCVFSDGNNAATVSINLVHQSLVTGK